MPGHESLIGREGLRFFGTMTASISHELKNALSIINEGAGLLEDLAAMAARGVTLDPARLVPLGEKIRRQVKRADLIIKRMNRFAHTVDADSQAVDLERLLRELCDLTERFADMRRVTLEVVAPAEPVSVDSSPFLLQNALWRCLDGVMQQVEQGERLCLEAEKTVAGACIRIRAPAPLSQNSIGGEAADDCLPALLEGLGADVALEEDCRALCIMLPRGPGLNVSNRQLQPNQSKEMSDG